MTRLKDDLSDLIERREKNVSFWKRLLFLGLGGLFLLLGIIGSLLPIMPGIPFYIAGVVCLAAASERVRMSVNRSERKFPHGLRVKLRQFLRRLKKKPSSPRSPSRPPV